MPMTVDEVLYYLEQNAHPLHPSRVLAEEICRLRQEMEHLREALKAEHALIPPEWITAVTAARDLFSSLAEAQHSDIERMCNQHNADVLTKLLNDASAPVPAVTTAELLDFVREIANDHDCDSDAHRYGTRCYVCEAEKLLERAK